MHTLDDSSQESDQGWLTVREAFALLRAKNSVKALSTRLLPSEGGAHTSTAGHLPDGTGNNRFLGLYDLGRDEGGGRERFSGLLGLYNCLGRSLGGSGEGGGGEGCRGSPTRVALAVTTSARHFGGGGDGVVELEKIEIRAKGAWFIYSRAWCASYCDSSQ
jgi:hypothetical protein